MAAFLRAVLEVGRVREWGEHKLAALAGTGYATAAVGGTSVEHVAGRVALVLGAVALAAYYVSVLNDLADRRDDRAAGKPNRLEGRPGWVGPAAIATCVGGAVVLAGVAWHAHPAALALYAGTWLAFGAYSAPPLRLKARGLVGALADAAGAHVCPHLLMAVAVGLGTAQRPGAAWLVAVGVWALATGLRGALWHQLSDLPADVEAQVGTYARRSPRRATRLAVSVFTVELAALAAILALIGELLAWVALTVYLAVSWRHHRAGRNLVVVRRRADYRIAMHAFYVVYLPLALLVAAALRSPAALVVLAAHLVLFPREVLLSAEEAYAVLPRRRASRQSAVVIARDPQLSSSPAKYRDSASHEPSAFWDDSR